MIEIDVKGKMEAAAVSVIAEAARVRLKIGSILDAGDVRGKALEAALAKAGIKIDKRFRTSEMASLYSDCAIVTGESRPPTKPPDLVDEAEKAKNKKAIEDAKKKAAEEKKKRGGTTDPKNPKTGDDKPPTGAELASAGRRQHSGKTSAEKQKEAEAKKKVGGK